MGELRTHGPPGTGKTHYLSTQVVPKAAEKFGPENVIVTSFSRTAAHELAGRVMELPDSNIGTIHALCYHSLGQPELVKDHIGKWNNQYPNFVISPGSLGDLDDVGTPQGGSSGSIYLGRVDLHRARLHPQNIWTPMERQFFKAWTEFKQDLGVIDFTDMIEMAIEERPYAPGNPEVIIVDEAQDCNPLQLKLIRGWGAMVKWFMLVGDADQAIQAFTGASAEAFLTPKLDDKFERVLSQSYRVPAKIHDFARKIVKRISERKDIEYLPTEKEGFVGEIDCNYKIPHEAVSVAKEKIDQGKSVMFLTSCAYMLSEIRKILVDSGIPFHNPYRRRRADWNPLISGGQKKIMGRDLVEAFMYRGADDGFWNIPMLLRWIKYIQVGKTGLIRGRAAKVINALEIAVKEQQPGLHSSREVLGQLLSPSALQPAINRNPEWLVKNLLEKRQATVDFPLRIYKAGGSEALSADPKIVIGTIHSVKGGEADCVFLWPDISMAAKSELFLGTKEPIVSNWDTMHRVFYVAATRAREELYIMPPLYKSSKPVMRLYYPLPEFE